MLTQIQEDYYIYSRLSGNISLWHKKSFTNFDVIEKYASNISDFNNPNINILKTGTRRKVFKFGSIEELVVKSYPLLKFKEKLKHKKYGRQEFLNYKKLSGYAFIPKHYAYFEKKNWFDYFVNGNIIEYINGESIKENSAVFFDSHKKNTSQLIELIALMHREGIYHHDLSGENIIQTGKSIKIIDWQYCNLIGYPSDAELLLMISHLIRTCNITNRLNLLAFLESILQKCNHELDDNEFCELTIKLSQKMRLPHNILSSLTINDLRKIAK